MASAWLAGAILFAVNPCAAILMPHEYRALPGIVCVTLLATLALYSIGVAWVMLVQNVLRLGAIAHRCLTSWQVHRTVRSLKEQPMQSLGGLALAVAFLSYEGMSILRAWVG